MKFIRTLLLFLTLLPGIAGAQTPFSCGVSDQNLPGSIVRLMGRAHLLLAEQSARQAAAPRNICRVAVDIDSDTYLQFDKDTSRIRAYVLKQIHAVSQIYEREINTQMVVVRIHIWKDTEADPYRGESNIHNLINIQSRIWKGSSGGTPYDKAVLLYTKSVTGGASGLGELPGIHSVSPLDNIATIAHELGHNFGSAHTHDCSWAGGPIDFCANIGGGNCYAGKSLEDQLGTIMSYCGRITPLTFHPLCRAVMADHADKNLPKLTSSPDKAPELPGQITLWGSRFLSWDGQPVAEQYDLEVSTGADFTNKLLGDTTAISGYDMSQLKAGQPYFVRVRSVNALGKSAWSSVCQLNIVEAINGLTAPVLLSPAQEQRFVSYDNTNQGQLQFSVQPVGGATGYELQLTSSYDDTFEQPTKKISEKSTFSVQTKTNNPLLWRVRALKDGQTGPWSAIGRFYQNTPFNPQPSINSPTPLTTAYFYPRMRPDLTTKIMLSTDEQFSKVVHQSTISSNVFKGNIVGMFESLQPDTQYYLRAEDVNEAQDLSFPDGVISRVTKSFRTGTSALPSQWTFVNRATNSGLPQGTLTIVYADNALWAQTDPEGLFRIDTDSLTVENINRASTNGRVGGRNMLINGDKTGEVWLVNDIASASGTIQVDKQIGRLLDKSAELSNRIVLSGGTGIPFFSSFSTGPLAFYNYNAVYSLDAATNTLTKIYDPSPNRTIIRQLSRAGIVWMILYNTSTSMNELVELNLLTKVTRTFSSENTPQLGRNLNGLAVDALGNLWVSQSGNVNPFPALAKFDGARWSSFQSPAIPFYSAWNLANDPFGNLYVTDNASPGKLYRYDGQGWKTISELPGFLYPGPMTIDGRGGVWFNNGNSQLMRFNRCGTIAAPKIYVSQADGQGATLRAEGCTSTIWSWSNTSETVSEQLQRGSNQLVNPALNTTYRARCYDDGCSGIEAQIRLTAALPRLSIVKTNKTTYCPGDYLTATIAMQGSVEATNQFSLIFKSGTQQTRYTPTTSGSDLTISLPNALTPGRYVIYAESSQPASLSRDSVQITVITPPTAELSSNKTSLVPGDSARISIVLTGTAPWQFTRWDNQIIQARVSPYLADYVALQQADTYSITVSALSDAVCSIGTVKNRLTLHSLVLANKPQATNGIKVYPNPTKDWLRIEVDVPMLLSSIQLTDSQGKIQLSKQISPASRQTDLDISSVPSGTYLLQLNSTTSEPVIWKMIKL